MIKQYLEIDSVPAVVWGEPADAAYICVHGKNGSKEDAALIAPFAQERGCQVVSFDLPCHGSRTDTSYPCTAQNGVTDLVKIGSYAAAKWPVVSLYACSIGAYFSLVAYQDTAFEKCLFQSPVLNMERLIHNMMTWFSVSEDRLKTEKEIPTPMGETLSWDYLQYVRSRRIVKWNNPTKIICGRNDELIELPVLNEFVRNYNAELQLVNGAHYLHTDEEIKELKEWIRRRI